MAEQTKIIIYEDEMKKFLKDMKNSKYKIIKIIKVDDVRIIHLKLK